MKRKPRPRIGALAGVIHISKEAEKAAKRAAQQALADAAIAKGKAAATRGDEQGASEAIAELHRAFDGDPMPKGMHSAAGSILAVAKRVADAAERRLQVREYFAKLLLTNSEADAVVATFKKFGLTASRVRQITPDLRQGRKRK